MTITAFPFSLQSVNASVSPEVQMNENFLSLNWAAVFGVDPTTTTGLTFGYCGGRWGGILVAAGTLTLTGEGSPTPTNYVVVNRATGAVSSSINSTNWDDVANYARIYSITTTASQILGVQDHRAGDYGAFSQKKPLAWNLQTDNYTLALTDAEHGVTMAHATDKNLTIPLNSSVAFPVGTAILVAVEGAGAVTVVPTAGVTLYARTSGSPSIYKSAGTYAILTLIKRAVNTWYLAGDLA